MKKIDNLHKAWIQGFIDGCLDIKGTYTGVPPIPPLRVPQGVDPIEFYYQDGLSQGQLYALQTLSGNNKYTRK